MRSKNRGYLPTLTEQQLGKVYQRAKVRILENESADQVSGLKGQGQPCSEPLKYVLKILRILKKWDWAQGRVHQNNGGIFQPVFGYFLSKDRQFYQL